MRYRYSYQVNNIENNLNTKNMIAAIFKISTKNYKLNFV